MNRTGGEGHMQKTLFTVSISFVMLFGGCAKTLPSGMKEIPLVELRDKIRGGWAGQMIGVSFGAPTEFRYREKIIPEGELPQWSRERLQNSIHQDDLYVEMTFAEVLDKKGLDATLQDFGEMFRDAKYALWHANLAARRALRRGVPAGQSGSPRFNAHANDIDFQIEADFIGLMSPGMPVASNQLCERVGRVMNSGDGLYGGMFIAGMYAAAFFESDPRKIVEAGYAVLPPESPYAKLIADVLTWSQEHPDDWTRVWRLIEDKWNHREPCPAGALDPFNIDAKLNGAYVALGLLYGKGDFGQTMSIATRAGQDSDCNPSNAAGVLGVVLGYDKIPAQWKDGIDEVADQKFSFTNYSFREIVDSTVDWAVKTAERNGGKIEEDRLLVQIQGPEPAALDIWDDYGSPEEKIHVDDARWKWKGPWKKVAEKGRNGKLLERRATDAGATVEIEFSGSGVIVEGPYLPDGGYLEVYLDGMLDSTVDVFSDEEEGKGDEAVFHRFGLPLGPHQLRLVVSGKPYPGSTGSTVAITDLIVFR